MQRTCPFFFIVDFLNLDHMTRHKGDLKAYGGMGNFPAGEKGPRNDLPTVRSHGPF